MRPSRIFNFRLCRYLGVIHPDYLEAQLTAVQLAEWEAYNELEPIDTNKRMEIMLSTVLCVLINFLSSKGPKLQIETFIPDWFSIVKERLFPKKVKEMTPVEVDQSVRTIFAPFFKGGDKDAVKKPR